MAVPPRGVIYSLNDARQFDWPEGLRRYIDTIRQGRGQNPKQYSARYVCSLGGLGPARPREQAVEPGAAR
jgi:fructose-1,6-bisphosphatase I